MVLSLFIFLIITVGAAKKELNMGNLELINALDNGITNYLIKKGEKQTIENGYLCDANAVRGYQMLKKAEITDSGVFNRILQNNKITVGHLEGMDACDAGSDSDACEAFEYAIKYINKTFININTNLDIKVTYKEYPNDKSNKIVDALMKGDIDLIISRMRFETEDLTRGLLFTCSYRKGYDKDYENNYVIFNSFVARRDYEKDNNKQILTGNNVLATAYSAAYYEWTHDRSTNYSLRKKFRETVDNPGYGNTPEEKEQITKNIQELTNEMESYGDTLYYNFMMDTNDATKSEILQTSYPSLRTVYSSKAFCSVLYGHLVMVWMPSFGNKTNQPGYLGTHTTVGLEKRVLEKTFEKMGMHYGRRMFVFYNKNLSDPEMVANSYAVFKEQLDTNVLMDLTPLIMDLMSDFYYGSEFIANSIQIVFSSSKFKYSGKVTIDDKEVEFSLGHGETDVSADSLLSVLRNKDIKKCYAKGNYTSFLFLFYLDNEFENTFEITEFDTTENAFNAVGEKCDAFITDLCYAQYYFSTDWNGAPEEGSCMKYYLNDTIRFSPATVPKMIEYEGENYCVSVPNNLYTFNFLYTPLFKADLSKISQYEVKDEQSRLFGIVGVVFAGLGIPFLLMSFLLKRGFLTELISRCRGCIQTRKLKKARPNFTVTAGTTNAGGEAGKAWVVDDEW